MQAAYARNGHWVRPDDLGFRRLKGRVVHSSQWNSKKVSEQVGGDQCESRAEFAGIEVHVQVDLFGYTAIGSAALGPFFFLAGAGQKGDEFLQHFLVVSPEFQYRELKHEKTHVEKYEPREASSQALYQTSPKQLHNDQRYFEFSIIAA